MGDVTEVLLPLAQKPLHRGSELEGGLGNRHRGTSGPPPVSLGVGAGKAAATDKAMPGLANRPQGHLLSWGTCVVTCVLGAPGSHPLGVSAAAVH